ncbi:hypothetical protein JTB14_022431 [Gonioctena quinquepunctata]|nr:hypothetical protein JTB14_022431 [Gonioctena quinquepunctata]
MTFNGKLQHLKKIFPMGNCLNALYMRLFDYPLKKSRPSAYHPPFPAQEEAINKEQDDVNKVKTQYDKIMEEFNRLLIDKRMENNSKINGESWDERNLLKLYPEWNDSTLSYLHSLFVCFCDEEIKQINFKSFLCILESLGDESEIEWRRKRFEGIDADSDGYIEYKDFLYLVYNFNVNKDSRNKSLRQLCSNMTEKVKHVESLSLGQQLEYGLF